MYVPMILNKFTSAPEIIVPIIVIRQCDYVYVYIGTRIISEVQTGGGLEIEPPPKFTQCNFFLNNSVYITLFIGQ